MATVGAIIRKLQDHDPNDPIEDLLEKPEAVAAIRELLQKTSRIATSKIVRNRQPPKQKSISAKALKAILSVKNIELPTEVQKKYGECRQRPSTFWAEAGIRLDLETNSTKPIAAFLCEVYLGITRLKIQSQWDAISWRFFVIFFYDLVVSFGGTYFTSTVEDNLVLILSSSSSSPSITDTDEAIRGNLKRWVACGSRYALFSESFDKGAPFLLPQIVTKKTWEARLPLRGPVYERAMAYLRTEGICRKSKEIGADVFGTEIREAIIKPFRWGIPTFNAITSTSHTALHEQGELYVCPNPSPLVLQIGQSQEDLCEAVVQANINEQLPGQGQSNVPNPRHDHSTSTRPGLTYEQASLDPTGTLNSAFEQLMANQNAGGYQDSRNFWDLAAARPSNFNSGGYFSLLNQGTPEDFQSGVYIPPPSPAILLDFSNGVYIPPPIEPIPSNFSNDVYILSHDQALPLNSFNNE